MKKIKVYHNNRCSKSRQALALVNTISNDVEIVDYINHRVDKKDFLQVIKALEISPNELLRKGESDYKVQIKGKNLNEEQIIDLMLEYPKLIERPIVICEGKAIVARPPELVNDFLKN